MFRVVRVDRISSKGKSLAMILQSPLILARAPSCLSPEGPKSKSVLHLFESVHCPVDSTFEKLGVTLLLVLIGRRVWPCRCFCQFLPGRSNPTTMTLLLLPWSRREKLEESSAVRLGNERTKSVSNTNVTLWFTAPLLWLCPLRGFLFSYVRGQYK